MIVELDITSLAAGGDGVGRDGNGRVTFVPRSAPGDRVRARIVKETTSFARAELVEVVTPGARVEPPCAYFRAGCGGCQWQHVERASQLAAKQAIVAGALRKLSCTPTGDRRLVPEPIAAPAPPYGWRRRARFHVVGGVLGLYREGTHELIAIDHCPQLEPALDAALPSLRAPDGDVAIAIGHQGDVAVGDQVVEIEPGLAGSARDFAQASAAGNAALVQAVRTALGKGPGRVLELYAGGGNFTRAFAEDGWDVTPTDAVRPAAPPPRFELGRAADVLARVRGPFDAIVLDPPRSGAPEAIAGMLQLAPPVIVYISCDPATLARDAARLTGYLAERAWPLDLMPQTSHVEVVLRLVRS